MSLSQDDLPLLGANDRAENLWERIRNEKGEGGPRWVNRLLWRVLKVNRKLFYWRESSLFLVSSVSTLLGFEPCTRAASDLLHPVQKPSWPS